MKMAPSSPDVESLDVPMYFYQNPHTGATVSTALSLRQLCRMLCPVREGMAPILTPQTRCVQVHITNQSQSTSSGDDTPAAVANQGIDQDVDVTEQSLQQRQQHEKQQPSYSYGEWNMASEIPILREAACAQWYYSIRSAASSTNDNSSPKGPVSCRTLVQYFEESKTPVLVYAQGITEEWAPLDKLDNLNVVLKALTTQNPPPNVSEIGDGNALERDASKGRNGAPSATDSNVQDELEAFLSSTAGAMDGHDSEDNEGEYFSDGGTRYVKDPFTGNWIHEALAPPPEKPSNKPSAPAGVTTTIQSKNKKKNQKPKFNKRNAKCWIYVTGLPAGGDACGGSSGDSAAVTPETVAKYFSKAGLLDLDPETLQPKVKLYRDSNTGMMKGDASVCYARPESVELALSILDESPWDSKHTIRVQRATFQAKNDNKTTNDKDSRKRPRKQVSEAQRKVAKLALLQAQDEGFGGRLSGGRKGLRIIVVRHMLDGIQENRWEDEIQRHSEEFGEVEKITVISEDRIVIIKYVEPSAARDAIAAWHGQRINPNSESNVHAIYWDGVTDYVHTVKNQEKSQKEEKERHDQFGQWLESQEELPPELRLQVEQS